MVGRALRGALCALVGLLAGAVVGGLLVPDPTGPLAGVLSAVAALAIAGGLYRSGWLRGDAG